MLASMGDNPSEPQWMTLSVTVPHEIGDAIANFLHERSVPGLVLDESDSGRHTNNRLYGEKKTGECFV